jgi:hypothetical protein
MAGPIVFIHIPKTGGSTFASVLRRNYPVSDVVLPNPLNHEPGLEDALHAIAQRPPGQVRSIHGHVPLSHRDQFPADARFATLLRDPVRRQQSHYLMLYGKARLVTAPSFPEALPRGRLIDNLQTRLLCGLEDPLTRPADDELLAAALAQLDRFAFVGLVERFPESMLLAQERLGLRFVAYRRRNVRVLSPPPDDVDALREHNRLDLALYAHTRARIEPELERLRSRAVALARADEAISHRRPVAHPAALGHVVDYCRSALGARVQRRWALLRRGQLARS